MGQEDPRTETQDPRTPLVLSEVAGHTAVAVVAQHLGSEAFDSGRVVRELEQVNGARRWQMVKWEERHAVVWYHERLSVETSCFAPPRRRARRPGTADGAWWLGRGPAIDAFDRIE